MAPPAPPTTEADVSDGGAAAAVQCNGPTTSSGENGPRMWERPWTTSEIRREANNWSLAGDAGLLEHLREFSQRVLSRTHEIEQEVDGLVHEAKLTSVRVNNVFNDFIMLANTQFVENRVYDEDVSQETRDEGQKPEQEEKTREQREAELIPKVSEALRYGLDVIEQAFEKLDTNVANSDSEDDDDDAGYKVDPILEAKDPYINRPLPCLIGTPAFWQDDSVGLMDDVSDSEESDHGSISESEEENIEYSDSEEEERIKARQQKLKKYSDESETETDDEDEEDDESDEEMFGRKEKKVDEDEYSDEESGSESEKGENEATEKQPSEGKRDFASELASKIGAAIPKVAPSPDSEEEEKSDEEKPKARETRAESTSRKESHKHKKEKDKSKKKHKAKTEQEDEDLFGGGHEKEDDMFGKPGGLFSSGGGLFDDDNEGGLFDDIEQDKPKRTKKSSIMEEEEEEEKEEVKVKEVEKKTKSGKKIPKGAVSIFGGGDEDLFGESPVKSEDTQDRKGKPVVKSARSASARSASALGGGLFDDDDDEGDDLFAIAPKSSGPSKERAGSQVKGARKDSKTSNKDLFADDDEDDDADLFAASSKPETVPEVDIKPKQKKPEKKLPAGAVSMFAGGVNPLTAALKKQQRPVSDSEEEKQDLTDEEKSRSGSIKSSKSSGSVASTTKKTGPSPSPSANSLFGDEDIDDSLFTAKPRGDSKPKPKTTAAALFAEDDEDDLFSGVKKPSNKPAQTKKEEKVKTKAASLFDSDGDAEDDFFSTAPKTKDTGKKKPVGGVALFGGADILKKKTEPNKKDKPEHPEEKTISPSTASPKKTTVSLFDADEEDDADLFGAPPVPPPTEKADIKAKARTKSLFEDEDILFGGSEEVPGVDLFSKAGSVTEQPAAASSKSNMSSTNTTTKIGGATTMASTTDIFDDGDDDDDDLFGSAKPKSAPKKMDVAGVTTTDVTGVTTTDVTGVTTTDVAGVTTTDSTDTVMTEEEKPKAKPVETKPKKLAGAVSMFGGMDPSALLKKRKPVEAATENKEEKPVDKQEEKPLDKQDVKPAEKQEVKRAEKVKAADSLFDKDDEDDLFSSVKPKSKLAPPIVKPKPVRSDSVKSVEKEPSLDKTGEEADRKEVPPKTTVSKAKKPAGAVSMFGGVDPMAGFLKRSVSTPQKAEPPEEARDKEVDRKSSDIADKESEKLSSASESVVKTTLPSKIGKLKAGLAINPAALLPGAAPPVKEEQVVAASFDEPADAKTLSCVNKDRAKITRRRPMSRKGRKSMVFSQSFDEFTLPSPTEMEEPSPASTTDQSDSVPTSKSPVAHEPRSSSTDIFGNDDILGEKSEKPKLLVSDKQEESDIFSKGLFEKSKKESSVLNKDETKSFDGLFSDSSSKLSDSNSGEKDLFPVTASVDGTKVKESSKPEDDNEDLFASAKTSEASVKKQARTDKTEVSGKQEVKSVKKSAAVDDDIFADASINKKKEPKPKLDVDDIFASSSVPAKPVAKAVIDDDDIFASAETKEKKKVKKAVVKDEALFRDDTDIFADIPTAKPKEPKKKKKVASTEKKSIFKDDIDDIFADSSPVATKPKKQTKKKSKDTSKTLAAEEVDIFDDPLLGGK